MLKPKLWGIRVLGCGLPDPRRNRGSARKEGHGNRCDWEVAGRPTRQAHGLDGPGDAGTARQTRGLETDARVLTVSGGGLWLVLKGGNSADPHGGESADFTVDAHCPAGETWAEGWE